MKTAMCRGLLALLLFGMVPAHSAQRNDGPAPYPSGLVCIPSVSVLNYVEQPLVQADLKLTTTQQAQLDRLHTRLAEAESLAWAGARFEVERAIELSDDGVRLLGRILTPEQSARHSQIVLQHLVSKFGLVQIVGLLDVVVVLDLDAGQSAEVQTILESIGYGASDSNNSGRGGRGRRGAGFGANAFGNGAMPPGFPAPRGFRNPQAAPAQVPNLPFGQGMPNRGGTRRGRGFAQGPQDQLTPAEQQAAVRARSRERLFAEFSNPDLTEGVATPAWGAYDVANDRISALLTAAQKQRLLQALGAALAIRPSGSPPAVVRGGTSLLAFPRFAPRPSWQRSFEFDSMAIADLPAMFELLQVEGVRQEIQLTNEQAQRLPPITGNPADAPVMTKLIEAVLLPAQFERLKQLVLQTARRTFGPVVLFEFKDVTEALRLDAAQGTAIAKRIQTDRQSTRLPVLTAVERNPDKRSELDLSSATPPTEILTPEQRRQLDQVLGKPFPGALSTSDSGRRLETRRSLRSRVAPSLGYLTSLPEDFLESRVVQQELRLSNDQRFATRGSSGPSQSSFQRSAIGRETLNRSTEGGTEDTLLKRLTPEQKLRYFEIVLQGSIIRDGPASVLRYRRVIDALAPTPEQEQKLLETVWQDTRRYLSIPLSDLSERVPELDRETAAILDSIWNPEQRQKLGRLLEESAAKLNGEPVADSPLPEQPTIESVRAVAMRRLVYPVRHDSAFELAEIARERFENAAGAKFVAAPEGNRLLIAAAGPVFDEIVASLPQLDRLRRIVVIDVMIAELPSFETSRTATDAEELLADKVRFTGTIELVTNRLNDLVKRKRINTLRQIRLEIDEDRTGTAQLGRDMVTITPNVTDTFRQGGSPFGFRALSAETRAAVKSRLTDPQHVEVELTLHDSRIVVPEDADEFAIGSGGPLIPRETLVSQLTSKFTVPLGEAAEVRGIQTTGKPDGNELRIVVAARLAESASP